MGNDNVLEKMIELQIATFREVSRLQKELDDLQVAYRQQCVTNAHITKTLSVASGYVQRERYIDREELVAMLGLPPHQQEEAMLDELSAEAERIEMEETEA